MSCTELQLMFGFSMQECRSSKSCMELYSMPQLDKTSPVYTNTQYEGGGEDITSRRTSTSDVKKVRFCDSVLV